MTTLFDFQFPESHKITFCWDADVRPKSEFPPISDFKKFGSATTWGGALEMFKGAQEPFSPNLFNVGTR